MAPPQRNRQPAHHRSNDLSGTVHGDAQLAGRDVVNESWHEYREDHSEPWDELFQGRGPGRLLMALGLLVALVGFAGWMYLIFQSGQLEDPGYSPFDERLVGLPAPMVAFGAFLAGGVLASIGMGMSRAARRREELARRAVRRSW